MLGEIVQASDNLDRTARAALAVDHLAALFSAHPGAKTNASGALYFADLVGVMHCVAPSRLARARRDS